jgi:Concanavalin A-like lectin/glucanases superfamily
MPSMIFKASRNAGDNINVPISIPFTVAGTATFATDYTVAGASTFSATSGSLIIPAGQVSAEMTISTVADLLVESEETIVLTPQAQDGIWVIGSGLPWTGTILNDDTAATTDPLFGSVGLLLHLDTNYADSSTQALVVAPTSTTISASTKQWGGGSAQFNGSSSQLTLPTSAVFSRGTGDFCWELWINPDTGSTTIERNILKAGTSSADGLSLTTARRLSWWRDGIGNLITGTPVQLAEGSWHYIGLSRSSGTISIWVNNALYTTFASTASYNFSGWLVGSNLYNSNFKGFIDDIRFTAVARSIAAAPTTAFPNT